MKVVNSPFLATFIEKFCNVLTELSGILWISTILHLHERQPNVPLFGYVARVFKNPLLIRIHAAALTSEYFCACGLMGDP